MYTKNYLNGGGSVMMKRMKSESFPSQFFFSRHKLQVKDKSHPSLREPTSAVTIIIDNRHRRDSTIRNRSVSYGKGSSDIGLLSSSFCLHDDKARIESERSRNNCPERIEYPNLDMQRMTAMDHPTTAMDHPTGHSFFVWKGNRPV